jgi:putative spermidine/putrescine transport system ATP-binding protein
MSDRLAVFSSGRIEQIGDPVQVYEQPASEFVAGFIGVSNLLERDGRRFTIRPEKIALLTDQDEGLPGSHTERGRIEDVAYLGMVTRYTVDLASGGTLIVVRQNTEAAAALLSPGTSVSVAWHDDHTFDISVTQSRREHV